MTHTRRPSPSRAATAWRVGARTLGPSLLTLALLHGAADPARAQRAGPAASPTAPVVAPSTAEWADEVSHLATETARAAFAGRPEVRVDVSVGSLDPRLKLAPCARVKVYLPTGQRAWGRTRIGVQCTQGAVPWNVYLPLTVKVLAPALVAAQALAAGTVLLPEHLVLAETDWAAAESPVFTQPASAVGRALVHGLGAGAALRESDLKKRLLFASGDAVRIVAVGDGFAVAGEGVAMSHGLEGQSVRVRTDSGRTVTGVAAGERRVEVRL